MTVFSSPKSRRSDSYVLQFLMSFAAMLWVTNAWAQPGGLGCLVDAGISPQEVCIEDHIALGGSPTVPEALSGEVASLVWSVVTPGVSVEFYPNAFDDNPQVYIDQITTFQVTMTLSDGSTCSSEVTQSCQRCRWACWSRFCATPWRRCH